MVSAKRAGREVAACRGMALKRDEIVAL